VGPLCEERGDPERAARFRVERARIGAMLEQAWDGEWYRRAYFDDGTPLGSSQCEEGRIDSVAQSWACPLRGRRRESGPSARWTRFARTS
jgi:Cellobiose phosphorylase